jgi:hypothetical protein
MPEQPTTNEARQGRNVRGMIWVLVIGTGLTVAAFMIMLAFSAEPVTIDGAAVETPIASPDVAAPTSPVQQETQ